MRAGVDEALAVAERDPAAAATTLGRLATPRAREELLQWADAQALDARAPLALGALAIAGDPRATPIALRWLERPDGNVDVSALVDVLTKSARVDDVGRIQALIAARPAHAAQLEAALDACRARTR